ncbi:MAG: TetR/AcrR family transcriptional regulator [Moraxellaceae bacterium]|nr:MAG: TetR/AcrR family transcriptional regulator [Moraxellaceae bacterium]
MSTLSSPEKKLKAAIETLSQETVLPEKKSSEKQPRRPGRPRATELQGDQLKTVIVQAAAQVYGQIGYNACTVELFAKAAGVSRALFYRLFKDKHEVVELVVQQANDELRVAMLAALLPSMDQLTLAHRMIGVYFDWCEAQGQVAAAIYHEFQNPESPAGRHRDQIVAEISTLWRLIMLQRGEKPLQPFLIDTLIRAVEHAGSSAFCPTPKSPETIQLYRVIAERILLAAIAHPADHALLPSIDEVSEG